MQLNIYIQLLPVHNSSSSCHHRCCELKSNWNLSLSTSERTRHRTAAFTFEECSIIIFQFAALDREARKDEVCLIPFDNSAQIYFPLALDVETSLFFLFTFPLVYVLDRHKMQKRKKQNTSWNSTLLANGKVSRRSNFDVPSRCRGRKRGNENEKLSSVKLKDFSSILDCVYPSNAFMIVLNYEIALMRLRRRMEKWPGTIRRWAA